MHDVGRDVGARRSVCGLVPSTGTSAPHRTAPQALPKFIAFVDGGSTGSRLHTFQVFYRPAAQAFSLAAAGVLSPPHNTPHYRFLGGWRATR